MANDTEVKKTSPDDEITEKEAQPAKSKDEREAKGAKGSKGDEKGKKPEKKKKKNSFVKFFKDARSEFKKVVWPSPKQTTNNTIVVIIMCIIAAIFVFGIDSLFALINRLILG